MLLIATVWIHVLAVIGWFGGSALMAFVVGPALGASSPASQSEVALRIATTSHRYYGILGGVTILSGLLLAWMTDRFASPFLWVVIVLAVFLAFWGARVTGTRADALAQASDAARPAAIARMVQAGTIEIIAFVVAFTLMILVRFGY